MNVVDVLCVVDLSDTLQVCLDVSMSLSHTIGSVYVNSACSRPLRLRMVLRCHAVVALHLSASPDVGVNSWSPRPSWIAVSFTERMYMVPSGPVKVKLSMLPSEARVYAI